MSTKRPSTSTTIVVRNPDAPRGGNKNKNEKKKRGKVPVSSARRAPSVRRSQPSAYMDQVQKWLLAVKDPWDPRVTGIMAPDDWPCSGIEARHVRLRGTLLSDSGGTLAFNFIPSLGLNLILTNGSISSNMNYAASSSGLQAGSTDATISSLFDAWRPVIGGVRIRNGLAFNNVSGSGIAAELPITSGARALNQATMNALGSSGVNAAKNALFGAYNSFPSTQMVALAGAKTFGCDQLINDDLTMYMCPCGPTAYAWRVLQGATVANSSTVILNPDATVNTVTGLVTYQNNCESAACYDMTSPTVYVDGTPASSNVFTFDYILHFEGRTDTNNTQPSSFLTASVETSHAPLAVVSQMLQNLSPILATGKEIAGSLSRQPGMVKGLVRAAIGF